MRNITNQNLSKYLSWNNFQIRNADNLTGAFEDMCKALFARKLGVQVADILEYKNQTGVECEPYVKHGEGWSFQAKFSDTKKVDFSAFRKSLFKAFEFKSTGEYKNLTQIICYTNENPIRKGTIRKEIEKQALKKSITIDWYFGKRILERLEESEYSDIRLHYFGGGQNLTLKPPVSTPSKSLSALKYQAEVTKFTGRSQELQYLEEFINAQEDVIWWAISGSGASGKSRLALELCQKYIDNGWCCGFYDKQLNNNELTNWEPEKPHLIIIDYASQEQESPIGLIKKAIQVKEEKELSFPIRVLLIDRDAQSTIQVIGKTPTFGEKIKNHLFKNTPLTIERLNKADLESIILDWTEFFELTPSESNQVLTYTLNNSSDRKILIAGLASFQIYLNGTGIDNITNSMEELVGELIDAEREKYWLSVGLDHDKENYLILATMSDGIQFDNISKFGRDAKEFIEFFDFPDLYGKIVGQPVSNRLEPLSHDLVSELYVLRSFKSHLPVDKKRFHEVIQLSLQVDGGQGLVSFFTRAAYDWIKHPTLQLLLTPFGKKPYEFIPWITLLANIIDKIDIPLIEKVKLFHDLVWSVVRGSQETYNNLSHVFESFFLRVLREANQNETLNTWVRNYSVAVVNMTQMERVNQGLEAERNFNTIEISADLRLKQKNYCDAVIASISSVEPMIKKGLTWPGLDEIYRHAVLHRLVDRDADIKEVQKFLSDMLSWFDINWPVASIFKDTVAGMIQFGHYHKKKDDVLGFIEYLIEDVNKRQNKQGLESFLSVISAAFGHAGVTYDKKIELLALWDSHFSDIVLTNEQVGTQFVGFSVALMHRFRGSADLEIALQQLERAEAVTEKFPNIQTIENLSLSLGQLIRRERELLAESEVDVLLEKQITLVKTYGEKVPKIVSNLISNISTLYSNAIRTNFESAQKYFNIAVEICRFFREKDISGEKLYLGELLRGEFEYYLKIEDFKSLCDLCDETSELQQFEFVDTNHFLLNTPATMFSSYQTAVRMENKLLVKNIASTAKYWLDNLYDNKLIDGIYTHIVNDHRSIVKIKG